MTTEIHCKDCQAVIAPANIDTQRDLATCGQCGRLMDLRRVPRPALAAEASKTARARPPVELPAGMSVSTGVKVVIRRRWLRAKHWLLLALFGGAGAYVAYLWSSIEPNAWLVIGTLFVLSWNFNVAAMFLNSTTVTADAQRVDVRHGPLPSLFARQASVEKAQIEQLYSGSYGPRFAVMAKLKSGRILPLVTPLITAEQALFVEQQLERILGLADFRIEGELNDPGVDLAGKPAPGAASGAVLALLIPALIAGVVALFFFIARTEVSGRLQAKGALGNWTFTPDDCASGQREGFGGVVLSSSRESKELRLVRDPVRGNLLVVVTPGQPNQVLAGEGCARFQAIANRTDTSINDIWVVQGSLSIDCPDLSGSLKFDGCH
jgi:hypothetical protein